MTEAKDFAALSFTFTAGIAAGTLIFTYLSERTAGISSCYAAVQMSAVFCFTAIGLAAAMKRPGLSLIMFLYLTLGVFCASTACISGIGYGQRQGWLEIAATGMAEKVKSLIDSIPFGSESTAPLLKALLTGDRSGLSRDTVNAFRESGASHILALSGLHLGIIYVILYKALSFPGNAPAIKNIRSVILISAAGFYTIATGASASLTRAFLFILLNESAKMSLRRSDPLHMMCAALMIQLTFSPQVILTPGFQLSYLAMAGIFILLPRLKSWFPDDGTGDFRIMRKIWNAAAVAISCQVFTAPAAWWHFRTFPRYFLITNILALPLTTALMVISIATVTLYAAGFCPEFAISVTDWAASALIFIVDTVSGM
ncbi:MAG: ComEC/Rec2 family competence protein [Candidatus Cryptobacteroides sp.]